MKTLRSFRFLCLFIAIGILAPGMGCSDKSGEKPNIVFYITDDQSQEDASAYGAPELLKTPAIEHLARDGMVFDNAFVASPACAPSRAALLTGLMPARNGAERNHTHPQDTSLYLTYALQSAGYEVSAFGKVAHANSNSSKGFNYYDNVSKRGDLSGAVKRFYESMADKEKPQCILVGDKRPHVSWIEQSIYNAEDVILPPYFIDTKETREHWGRYLTDITGLDTELGKVYKWTTETFGDNFIFIYTADHGGQWPFGKWNLYDAGIEVPFIVVWPERVEPGKRTEAMISWVDVFPTLLDIIGTDEKVDMENLDGKSFLNVLRGKAEQHREFIFTTHSGDGDKNVYPIRSVRSASFKYIVNLHPELYHSNHSDMLRKDGAGAYWNSWDSLAEIDPVAAAIRYKYYIRPSEEFFNLDDDPNEQKNLINDLQYQNQISEMKILLKEWMKEQGDKEILYGPPYPITGPRPYNTDTIKPL